MNKYVCFACIEGSYKSGSWLPFCLAHLYSVYAFISVAGQIKKEKRKLYKLAYLIVKQSELTASSVDVSRSFTLPPLVRLDVAPL